MASTSTISSSTSTSLVIPGRSGLVVVGDAWGENGNQVFGNDEIITVRSPEFLPDGTIRGIVDKTSVGHLSITSNGHNKGFPMHPLDVLGAMFPIALIRHTGCKWYRTEGVKIVVLNDGKIFGIIELYFL